MLTYVSHGPRDFGEHPVPSSTRPAWEFYAVLRGHIAPLFGKNGDGELGGVAERRSATLWLFRPECVHGWVGERNRKSGIAVFHFAHVSRALERAADAGGGWVSVDINRPAQVRLGRLARELQPHCWNPDALFEFHSQRALAELTILVLGGLATPHPNPPAKTTLSAAARVQAAEDWFRAHLAEFNGVRNLARCTGTSEAHLRRLFLSERGCSPKERIDQIR
ncbi:MAG: helix-turn-helix transcriptional regulator, partial [Opitutaceae bacterium]|nr:helix-turn-helix transcriptional regulator [Opitutaceae bacterium]